jgi:hypothetical protein
MERLYRWEQTSYFPVDYVLRAMMVPEGKHIIEFKFEPGDTNRSIITIISGLGILLLLVAGVYITKVKVVGN